MKHSLVILRNSIIAKYKSIHFSIMTKLAITSSLLLAFVFLPLASQNLLTEKKKFSVYKDKENISLSADQPPVPTQPQPVIVSTQTAGPDETAVLPSLTPQEEAGEDLLEFLGEKGSITYSRDRWLKMRRIREGEEAEPGKEGVVVSTATRPEPPPLPPGLAMELPYESQLSISGRKLIGLSWKSTVYDQPESQKRVNSNSIDMTQELQVRIKGRVGRKINVNVDFDDTTPDKRDISVVYKGDPDEVIQEAAFGDIAMSLPSTEFVGYSRQLFGIKVDAKYKNLRTWGFFSRTKGFSEVKRFAGNTKFEPKTISDTAYIPYKYYLLAFGTDKIKSGSVKVYKDDRLLNNNYLNISSGTAIVESPLNTAKTYTGNFDLLVPGQDYTVDYNRGYIVFRNTLGANQVVAIDYQKEDGQWLSATGTPGRWKIIKDESNDTAISRELKVFYNLGNIKIIRDNGRGNFVLNVQDLQGNTTAVVDATRSVPRYPDNITVDFETGVFNFEPLADSLGMPNKPLHESLYNANKEHRYNIYAEYRYRIKFVSLRAGIVPQSERVSMDGRILQRDSDYYIDYDAGIVTFFDENKINENTVIEVSYDYAPFGGAGGSTLVGVRSELSLTKNIFVGASFIYDFAAKTQSLPDVRTAPTSLMVGETDFRIQNIKVPYLPMTMSIGAEGAMSERNPNIMDKALVESMEGIKQEDSASLYRESWQLSANPGGEPYYIKDSNLYDLGSSNDIAWDNINIRKDQINSNFTSERQDEEQQVLRVKYNLNNSSQVSIIQNLSTVGLDFTKKQYLEFWIHGDNSNEELLVEYGSFNEDVDGDMILDTEDTVIEDGVLNADEDKGWRFNNPDTTSQIIGYGNSRLDTEDLDNDQMLDSDNPSNPLPYGISDSKGISMSDSNNVEHNKIDWTGWKMLRVPLKITNIEEWQAIKQVRLTIRGSARQSGSIMIANLAAVGNRWESSSASTFVQGSTLTVSAISTEDPSYASGSLLDEQAYKDLYDVQDIDKSRQKEQALQLKYDVAATTAPVELSTKLLYTKAYDFSNYKKFRFFIKPKSSGDTFFIQIGNDTNYYEYSTKLEAGAENQWHLVTITQYDVNKDNKPDRWAINENGDAEFGVVKTTTIGAPSFQNISQIKMGVRATGPKTAQEIWINDIHVTESWKKSGYAWRANADFAIPQWTTFGLKRKAIDRSFETFSAGVYNRDYLEDNAYLNIDRLSFMPITSSLNRTRTITPAVILNQNDLISKLDEGRVTTYNGSLGTTINPIDPVQSLINSIFGTSVNMSRYFPKLGGQYTRAISDTQQIQRLEDRETYTGTLEYTNPLSIIPVLPKSVSANYSLSNSWLRVYPSTRIIDTDTFLDFEALKKYNELTEYQTLEISETLGLRTPFQFWSGFTLSPSYSLKKVKEKNKLLMLQYPKSADQNVSATASIKVFRWFQPNLSYSINTAESYNLAYNTYTTVGSTPTYPGQAKHIDRNSSTEASWNFQVKDFISFPFTQSLSFQSSYRMQDSDSYDNVESSYSVVGLEGADKLWIRNSPLQPSNTGQYIIKSIVRKDDVRVSGRYNPFEALPFSGRLSPIRTLSTNFTYTTSEEHSIITGTPRDVLTKIWPDLILSLNQAEKLFWLEKWLQDCQINLRHQFKTTRTEGASLNESTTYGGDLRFNVLRKLDLSFSVNSTGNLDYDLKKEPPSISLKGDNLSWSSQVGFNIKSWRCTLRYDDSESQQVDGTGKLTSHSASKTYTGQFYSDISFPGGIPIPFTAKTLPLTNRLIFNGNVKYATVRSNYDKNNNTNNYGFNMNVDYEVSQNFRFALGAGWNRFEKADRPPEAQNEDYQTIEVNSRLTIQF